MLYGVYYIPSIFGTVESWNFLVMASTTSLKTVVSWLSLYTVSKWSPPPLRNGFCPLLLHSAVSPSLCRILCLICREVKVSLYLNLPLRCVSVAIVWKPIMIQSENWHKSVMWKLDASNLHILKMTCLIWTIFTYSYILDFFYSVRRSINWLHNIFSCGKNISDTSYYCKLSILNVLKHVWRGSSDIS